MSSSRNMRAGIRMCGAVVVGVQLLCQAGAPGSGVTLTVALTGDPAPGTAPGVDFSGFFTPVLNDAGQVAFLGQLTGSGVDSSNERGIWGGGPGSVSLVARAGSQAPGVPAGVNFFSVNATPVLNDAGQVAFWSTLIGSGVDSSNNEGIWQGAPGSLSIVARKGSQAPGTASGVNFSFFSTPTLNDAGQTAFFAMLTGSGVTSSNNEGIWRGVPGNLSLVARSGTQAPGTGPGVNFSLFTSPALNHSGQVAFLAELTGSGVDPSNYRGIWWGVPGSLSLVARKGSHAPGTPSGVNFDSMDVGPVLNDAGQVAFVANLTGSGVDSSNDRGVWRGALGNLELVARRGSPAPGTGPGVNYALVGTPVLNDPGQVAFLSTLTGSGVDSSNDRGIWRGEPGSVELIARRGAPAPGTGPGVNYALFNPPVLNDAGQVAFRSTLTGSGVDATNSEGIWIGDGSESLMAVRSGQTLAGKTVSSVALVGGSAGSDGRQRSLNEFAQLTYRAAFTDGSQGVFLFTPEVRWRSPGSGSWDQKTNWTLSIPPAYTHDVMIDPAGSLVVTRAAGASTVRSLTVGGGTGLATLALAQGGTITAETIIIETTGRLTGDGTLVGTATGWFPGIENYGTIIAENLTVQDWLWNYGVIRGVSGGDDRINTNVLNFPGGEVRVLSGQSLDLRGAIHGNAGRIEVIGGLLEVHGPLDHSDSGELFARDAHLRFQDGLDNYGLVGFSFGTSDVFGHITNDSGAQIIVSGNSNVTFYNAITHYDGAEIRVGGGSTAVFFGPVTGSGAFTGGGAKFFEAGISSLGTIETTGSTTVQWPASLTADAIRESSLSVAGEVNLRPGGGSSRVGSLAIDSGRLDIGDNQILIETATVEQVHGWLMSGRPGGGGIGSALAAGESGRDVGFAPTAEGVLVKYTFSGDANLDGRVTIADLSLLASNWQRGVSDGQTAYWFHGDFNYDGRVTIADLSLLASNWQAGVPAGESTMSFAEALAMFDVFNGVVIPEPGSVALVGLGALAVLRRRERVWR